ncbi:MAG TPA: ATP-grasp domain-containing protein [Terracidiphilus sp.]|nr:ATP-grasp domain-containing protein [Terracidiphilus sp.]
MNIQSLPRLKEIRQALKGRGIVWFGTRGIDALEIYPLARPVLITAQIAPVPPVQLDGAQQDNLELRSRLRRDLDLYDVDRDPGLDAVGLKTEFLAQINAPVVLVAYRAMELLCRPSFCHPTLVMATPFHLLQRQFEYKPWVEQQLLRLEGVPVLKSIFVRDGDVDAISSFLANGPSVGRCSTSSGGSGVFPFATEEEYFERLPSHPDGFVGLTPLLDRAAPLNVNACVYSTGEVAVFGVSFQLIGVRGLTRRTFGFCGNDFGAASDVPPEICDRIESCAETIGRWLFQYGYRGVFGLDILWNEGKLYVTEVNPRFQASTPLSAGINQTLGFPDPMTEHIAAFLGLGAPTKVPVAEQTRACGELRGRKPIAQVVHRNISTARLRAAEIHEDLVPGGVSIVGAPESGIYIEREAMLFKSLHCERITADGYSVSEPVHAVKKAVTVAAY